MTNELPLSTVLIVDDSPSNIRVMAAVLQERYRVKTATSGQQCLDMALRHKPDLILLDIEMPGISGYETCRELKDMSETRDIPVIFVTGRDNIEDEEMGLRIGAVDYITKPIRPVILSARVDTHVTLKRQQDRLLQLAMHDQLTGLYNRHYMLEMVDQRLARARRHNTPLSLLIVDLDHFKQINDTHGHIVGDQILEEVSTLLNQQCRTEDTVTRFGGEEFLILMEPCSLNQAHYKAEVMRHQISELMPSGIKVTVSIGAAEFSDADSSFNDMLKRADDALYRAKANGRNQTELSHTTVDV
ncbi:MAG: diguanylate cyclase response regulator [Thalassolituus sp.]|jgi:diguanylate cyclase (GGDEF)-like protein|nr:diguanylate cyclase [Pseudomonadota bacterium]MEC8103975.1 diguanylate cyclase [Pseudomonadota bacterium]MEE2749690.1 diguanylate cyclase [Pseudomonadota bacterium]TNC85212.1 MAG: diguanylate cyclase response regulator [Thalassolituus sp.]|tara:strand:+ start:145 stop:1047 length:903 start_codon:yes stop_codon:yes gene_type:complete